jgi:tetratricopeptide (TPR) repeat protein
MAAGDIALKRGDSAKALTYYKTAWRLADSYGGEGRGYQILPRIGLAYLGVGQLDNAERELRKLRELEQIPIGKLYGDYGLAMVAYKRGEIQSARELLEDVEAQLSRRTTSNLLRKLIESQKAQLPGLVQELEHLDGPQTGIRFPKRSPGTRPPEISRSRQAGLSAERRRRSGAKRAEDKVGK